MKGLRGFKGLKGLRKKIMWMAGKVALEKAMLCQGVTGKGMEKA